MMARMGNVERCVDRIEGFMDRIAQSMGSGQVGFPAPATTFATFDWRNVNTWQDTLRSPSGPDLVMAKLAGELKITPSSPSHVLASLELMRTWITMVMQLEIDFPGTEVATMGNALIAFLREAHFAREGVNMGAFHRMMAAEDSDPMTAAAAKAGVAERKSRLRPGTCFTCGEPGHISPNCPQRASTTATKSPQKGGGGGAPRK